MLQSLAVPRWLRARQTLSESSGSSRERPGCECQDGLPWASGLGLALARALGWTPSRAAGLGPELRSRVRD